MNWCLLFDWYRRWRAGRLWTFLPLTTERRQMFVQEDTHR
jgi:hypothetical protein